jgi:hypothetical protein
VKRHLVILATLALSAFALAGTASAATIDQRQFRQHARIHSAMRHRELTRAELMRLRAGQAHVRRVVWRARRDGRLTMRERMRVQRGLDRQSLRIHRLAHNRRAPY